MKTLTKCIFDMDGLLIDTEKGMWFISEGKALDDLGYSYTTDFFVSLMGTATPDCKIKMLEKYGNDFPFEEYAKLVSKYNDEQINSGNIKVMSGTFELLDYLKSKNIECVIGTGTIIDKTLAMLRCTNLLPYFQTIVTRYEVENGKPAPDIFLKCLGNTDKESALVFEDSRAGLKAAINSGIPLVLVPDCVKFLEEEKSQAFKVIYNLKDAITFIEEMI